MTKKITSYKQLVEERQKLEELLKAQKQLLRADVLELKAQLTPLREAFETIKKFTTKDKNNPLITYGTDALINTVVKNFLLAKTGWLTRLVIPYFVKNFSSHVVAENKETWLQKLRGWLGHKNGKHKKTEKHEDKDFS